MQYKAAFALVIAVFCSAIWIVPTGHAAVEACPLAVLADEADPYYPLAQEIVKAEGIPIVGTIEEAILCGAETLLWVAEPGSFSDQVLVDYGLALKKAGIFISMGIITGVKIEDARALYQRSEAANSDVVISVNAPNPAAYIFEGKVVDHSGVTPVTQDLSTASFRTALQAADYLTFTGHGGRTYLRLADDLKFESYSVPLVDGLVIETGSCRTFMLQQDDMLPMRFIAQGAAVYAGFQFSPNEGFLMGEFDGLAFRYTWPEFTVGQVLQVQTRGTMQGFAVFPYLYMVGDPRTALGEGPAYLVERDEVAGRTREIELSGLPGEAGEGAVIPVHIQNGAKYQHVRVDDLTAGSVDDPFYNSKLQMAAIGDDLYLLVMTNDAEISLTLQERPPLGWFIYDMLFDSFDHTLIWLQGSEGALVALAFSVIPLTWAVLLVIRRKVPRKEVKRAVLIGVVAAIGSVIYMVLRVSRVTIVSKIVVVPWSSVGAMLILLSAGAVIFWYAKGKFWRWMGIASGLFIFWVGVIFHTTMILFMNLSTYQPNFGTGLWNINLGLAGVPALLVVGGAYIFALWKIKPEEFELEVSK